MQDARRRSEEGDQKKEIRRRRSEEGDQKKEIRRRIEIAKSTFTSMNKVLISISIDIAVRMRVLKCYVWSTLLYGWETWTISGDMMKKLEALVLQNNAKTLMERQSKQ